VLQNNRYSSFALFSQQAILSTDFGDGIFTDVSELHAFQVFFLCGCLCYETLHNSCFYYGLL